MSYFRDFRSVTSDNWKTPRRPTIIASKVGNFNKPGDGDGSVSPMYKIHLVQSNCNVARLEIRGCVQRLNHPEISRWKQIAEIDLKEKKTWRKYASSGHTETRYSVKIAGFSPGFRYQMTIRTVDSHGKRSSFSKPIFIIPEPINHQLDDLHSLSSPKKV